MTTFFRILRLLGLATWVGGLVLFGFVAQVAFSTLPDTHEAGLVVRGSLIALHHIGITAGLIYLIATLALLATQRDTHPIRAAELALVIAMLALTTYSQLSVIPRMEADRISLGGDVDKASHHAPAYIAFQRLHDLSVKLEGAVLIEGLLLLAMAAIHERGYDRFA